MKRLIFVLLLLAAVAPASRVRSRTIRILNIGNSLTENAIEQGLHELALEGGDTLLIGDCYRPEQSLAAYWREAENEEHKIEYRKIACGVRTTEYGRSLRECLRDEPWDYIVFQQSIPESGVPESYEPALACLIEYAKILATNPEVRFGFHQTWAYARNAKHKGFARYADDQQIMFRAIRWASAAAACRHDALCLLIPCGEAIQRLRATRMGDNFCDDGCHLNAAGRYAAACTWLVMLTGQDPARSTYKPAEVAEKDALLIRREVARAVRRQ